MSFGLEIFIYVEKKIAIIVYISCDLRFVPALSQLPYQLVTRGFELVTRAFKLVICGSELVTRGFKLVTREFELVALGFELVTRISELVTCNS